MEVTEQLQGISSPLPQPSLLSKTSLANCKLKNDTLGKTAPEGETHLFWGYRVGKDWMLVLLAPVLWRRCDQGCPAIGIPFSER